MADTAFMKQYRQQTLDKFEVGASLLADSCTPELVISGNEAIFLNAGSGGATATTRGVDGRVPSRANDLEQVTCTLQEWHDKPTASGFNIFASQGSLTEVMQRTTVEVINRKLDELIITELATATQDVSSTAVQMSLDVVGHALAILGNADVPIDGEITGAITPAAHSYLMQIPEYASADYVEMKPLAGMSGNHFANRPKARMWADVKWVVHPNLTNAGLSTAECYIYHRRAMGCAMDRNRFAAIPGYNSEDDYSFARCTMYGGAKLLQNTGVVVIPHDDSDFAAV